MCFLCFAHDWMCVDQVGPVRFFWPQWESAIARSTVGQQGMGGRIQAPVGKWPKKGLEGPPRGLPWPHQEYGRRCHQGPDFLPHTRPAYPVAWWWWWWWGWICLFLTAVDWTSSYYSSCPCLCCEGNYWNSGPRKKHPQVNGDNTVLFQLSKSFLEKPDGGPMPGRMRGIRMGVWTYAFCHRTWRAATT